MRGLVSFVEQFDDHHYAALTVRETLRYAAILRLPASVSLKRKIARADEVLHMLGLGDCSNTLVGGPLLKVRLIKDLSTVLIVSENFNLLSFRGYLEVKSDVSAWLSR